MLQIKLAQRGGDNTFVATLLLSLEYCCLMSGMVQYYMKSQTEVDSENIQIHP